LLSRYRMLAATPDYVVFDLRQRATANGQSSRADSQLASVHYFYDFPPAWKGLVPGLPADEARRLVGTPSRTARWTNLGEPVEEWFYGPRDKYAIIFVGGRVFVKAQRYR